MVDMASEYLPSMYKARNVPLKQPVCAICLDRTRGKTQTVDYGYGVIISLCQGHASPEFQRQRRGRDLVLTLMRLWQANGCLTTNRHKALDAHLNRLKHRPAKPLAGSYAWPKLRRRAEAAFAQGAHHATIIASLDKLPDTYAERPSARTIRRWRTERRWLNSRPP
jgi:hypothetical protein